MDFQRPCVNCRAFHYGHCYKGIRQCWKCHGFGHIKRYCPIGKRSRGKLLPGSKAWCQVLGLNDDPDLQRGIQTTLKDTPGAMIFLNNECIYRGVETHFYRKALPKGLDLVERLSRASNMDHYYGRSRSPSRERAYKRSRSPIGRYSRSRSPLRQKGRSLSFLQSRDEVPQFERRALPSVYSISSDEFTPLKTSPTKDIHQAHDLNAQGDQLDISYIGTFPVNAEPIFSTRPPLGLRSANIPSQPAFSTPESLSNALQHTCVGTLPLEDPYFVLGIRNAAPKSEVIAACEQRMWEIELERISEGNYDMRDSLTTNRWDESIKIINAARKQLLGY